MKRQFLGLVLWLLALSPVFAQSNTIPRPNENLKDYEARMTEYFAPQIAKQGEAALLKDESSEYNRYRRFRTLWDSRLLNPPINGDFKVYFELENNFYTKRRRSGPSARPVAQGSNPVSATASLLSAGSTAPWQEIGPIEKPPSHVGSEGTGPIRFITFDNSAPSRILAGSGSGGLFYSNNGGVFWTKTGTDTEIGPSGVGAAVFDPGDYKTWFASSAGNSTESDPLWIGLRGGVFRTTDEGATWTQIGSSVQLGGIWTQIFKMEINPANSNQLWVATSAGLYVTNNAHALNPAWAPAIPGKYVYDLKIRPGDPNWLYATIADWNTGSGPTWINWRYMFTGDNGSTWQNVPGQPASTLGASGLIIAVSPAKPTNLYCVTVHPGFYPSELYIYDFATNIWNLVYGSADLHAGYAFGVDPFDPNAIYLSEGTEGRRYNYLSSTPFVDFPSTYSGGTYHPDIECFVPHPATPSEVWGCTHGGAVQTKDSGLTWVDRSTGLATAMVNRMATGASDPGAVALGLYHTGTTITTSAWYPLWSPGWRVFPNAFCDGMRPLIDPTTTQYMEDACQWGAWGFSHDFGITFGANGPSSPSFDVEAAFNRLSPQTQYRLAAGGNGYPTVMRTPDRGTTWTQIADFHSLYQILHPTWTYELWKVYTPETNGDHLLVHVLERPSPLNPANVHHRLYRTKIANDANAANVIASWEELPLPEDRWISDVDFDPVNPNLVYISNSSSSSTVSSLTGTGMVFKMDSTNPAAHTYNSCTPGVCQDLTQNLPNATTGTDSLGVEQGSNEGLYFASDWGGVWYSNKATRALGGGGWTQLGIGLPNVLFTGVEINYLNNKIRVGSSGRGAWEGDLATGCIQPPPSPALWLPLDEVAGSTALNAASVLGVQPGMHAGVSMPTAAGKVSGALCFNGAGHVDVPTYAAITFGSNNFSLDAWVRHGAGTLGTEVLVDKRTSVGPTTRGYSLFLSSGQIGLQLADGTLANYVSSGTLPFDGQWHHVAVTVDRNNPAGGRFYLDGQPLGPPFNPTGHPGSLSTPAPFRVGARSFGTASGLHGCVDEVEAFGRVLNADEVLGLYRAGSNGKCKLSCALPSLSSFCGAATTATMSAQICNDRPAPVAFTYSFQPLPVQSGCTIAGPVAFTPISGTLTVPAGKCAPVPTVIGRPTALTNVDTSCYQMQVAVPSTQETFTCGAMVDTESCNGSH